mgnify:CR=1 FL=1
MALKLHAARPVHFIPLQPVHLKLLQVVHLFRCTHPATLHSPYGRQFKDSTIGTLRLPKEWKDGVSLDKYGCLHLTGWCFSDEKYGYLRWPSTQVGKLEFY